MTDFLVMIGCTMTFSGRFRLILLYNNILHFDVVRAGCFDMINRCVLED